MSDNLYDPGTRIRLSGVFEVAGVETDPTTITLKVRKPTGTTTTYAYPATITKDSTGRFHMDITPAGGEQGRWFYKFIGTGDAAAERERSFRVREQVIS
jgi:uncharacterized protein YfaS (alpha-2-macroglobulin family)